MKHIKSLITAALIICALFALMAPAMAMEQTVYDVIGKPYTIGSNDFCVKYNGEAVVFPDAQPFVDANGRTLVPVRFVSETMQATITWEESSRTATIVKGDITVKVTIGNNSISVEKNGKSSTVAMDTKAVLKDGRTFVPIRFIAEALGAYVGYSDLYNTVQIYADELTPAEITRLRGYYDRTFSENEKAIGSTPTTTEADWIKNNPQIQYFANTGTYGFDNANEWILRNSSSRHGSFYRDATYTGKTTGRKYKYGTQPEMDLVKLLLDEAKNGVVTEFDKGGIVKGSLRADMSCIFYSRHSTAGQPYIRGILVIEIPQNPDVAAIRNTFGITNPKAGEIYEFDVVVVVRVIPYESSIYYSSLTTDLIKK